MRKTLAMMALVAAATASAQTANDPVAMVINGKPVLRSEFVYSYDKNNGPDVLDHKTVDEYVDLFVNYKLKVEAALEAKMDTATSYKKEYRQYRDMQVLPTIITDADVEKEALNIYNNTKESIGPDGLVNPQHILIRVPQNAENDYLQKAKDRADSVYNALMAGADFATLAAKVSEDPGSAPRGGEIGFISKGRTLKAFEDAAFALQPGQLSAPVLSEVGYHIIKMKERKQLESFDSLRSDILSFIEKRNLRESIAQNRLKELAESAGVPEEVVMDQRADSLATIDPEMKYLFQEYHDGLLLYEASNREVWEKASKDEAGLEKFFKANKKKYKWDEPRFKGIAYYTRDAADIDAVKKSVKGKKFSQWADVLRSTFNNDSILRIRVEKGVFKKGDNGLVDFEQFGVADAKVKNIKDFDNRTTFGKMLKAPEEMSDVRSLVVADYQELLEQEWLKKLKARYTVTVNFDVIDTVKK